MSDFLYLPLFGGFHAIEVTLPSWEVLVAWRIKIFPRSKSFQNASAGRQGKALPPLARVWSVQRWRASA